MANRVTHIFRDADLRGQHNGLTQMALDHKVRLDKLGGGDHVLFINTRTDKVKIMSAAGVLSYYRSPKGKLNLNAIAHLPEAFAAGKFSWEKADNAALDKLLEKFEKKKPGLLT